MPSAYSSISVPIPCQPPFSDSADSLSRCNAAGLPASLTTDVVLPSNVPSLYSRRWEAPGPGPASTASDLPCSAVDPEAVVYLCGMFAPFSDLDVAVLNSFVQRVLLPPS
eukprot:GGOE01027428.1.p3 GENE.GGOE01027428.1~~GGOE01027428.1.p3  ORF type:complete len:110 (-),score=13.30 GGOE01027428.1:144-473(-)